MKYVLFLFSILFLSNCSSEIANKETEPEEELFLDDEELSNSYAEDVGSEILDHTETQVENINHKERIIKLRNTWPERTDEEIFADINSGWTPLTKIDGEWVIFSECRYGAGGLYFDFEERWLEFSGGGDAYSQDIVKLQLHDNHIEMHYKNLLDTDYEPTVVQLYFTEDNILIFKRGEAEERYVAEYESNRVKFIEEECDEEDY